MAPSISQLALALSAAFTLVRPALAWQDTDMCTDGGCTDCPWHTAESETGYPRCQIYDTAEFAGSFPAADKGGLEVFFNIDQPDPGCAMLIRSPASTSDPGCGENVITAYNAACAFYTLKNTFMLQWCCGDGDCAAAGASKRDLEGLESGDTIHIGRRSAGTGSMMISRNGTLIEPIEQGEPPELFERGIAEKQEPEVSKRSGGSTIPNLSKRDCAFTQEGASFTSPGSTRVIEGPYTGPVTPSLSSSQTVGWTTSVNVGINIEIFSAGVEFSVTESETQTVGIDFEVPDGQTGYVVWTPILRCATGTLSGCDDNEDVTFCSPDTNDSGSLRGSWAFQQRF